MADIFYTDPHLGLKRQAGTTPASSAKLRSQLYTTVQELINKYKHKPLRENTVHCLGDLFDKYSNDEATIMQAMSVMLGTDHLMAGNHDVRSNAQSMGSVQLLQEACPNTSVVIAKFGQTCAPSFYNEQTDTSVTMIPHHTTQELFEQVLLESSPHTEEAKTNILCLHCNYNLGFEMNETTLNLSEDQAKVLLGKGFDYILLGHEHNQAEYLDGRVKIIGNTFPTSMSDIADKRVLIWDGQTFNEEVIWHKDTGYIECDWRDLPDRSDAQFIKVIGEVDSKSMQEFSERILSCWDVYTNLLMLSNKVDIKSASFSAGNTNQSLQSLPSLISDSIEDQAMKELWNKVCDKVA